MSGIAQRLRSYVASRGGPAKDEGGRAVGTTWPMMLEAAAAIEKMEAERDHARHQHDEIVRADTKEWFAQRDRADKAERRIDLLERYASSIAMWMERENVTDQERLSYIKGHPVTRAAADRSGK